MISGILENKCFISNIDFIKTHRKCNPYTQESHLPRGCSQSWLYKKSSKLTPLESVDSSEGWEFWKTKSWACPLSVHSPQLFSFISLQKHHIRRAQIILHVIAICGMITNPLQESQRSTTLLGMAQQTNLAKKSSPQYISHFAMDYKLIHELPSPHFLLHVQHKSITTISLFLILSMVLLEIVMTIFVLKESPLIKSIIQIRHSLELRHVIILIN